MKTTLLSLFVFATFFFSPVSAEIIENVDYFDSIEAPLVTEISTSPLSLSVTHYVNPELSANELTWSENTDATFFEIYRKGAHEDIFSLITMTNKTSFIDWDRNDASDIYYIVMQNAYGTEIGRSEITTTH